MSANFMAPGAQQKCLAAYLDGLAQAAGHVGRKEPLKAYCTGLLLPGERNSVELMAAHASPHSGTVSVATKPVKTWCYTAFPDLHLNMPTLAVSRFQVGLAASCAVTPKPEPSRPLGPDSEKAFT